MIIYCYLFNGRLACNQPGHDKLLYFTILYTAAVNIVVIIRPINVLAVNCGKTKRRKVRKEENFKKISEGQQWRTCLEMKTRWSFEE